MPFLYGSKAHEPLSRLSPVKELASSVRSHGEQPEEECKNLSM